MPNRPSDDARGRTGCGRTRSASISISVAAGPRARLPASRTGEAQIERPPVPGRPLGDDVGHEHAVVVSSGDEVGAGRTADVDAVHPRVAGEDDVDQEAEGPDLVATADLLWFGHATAADEARRPAASDDCFGRARGEAVDDLRAASSFGARRPGRP